MKFLRLFLLACFVTAPAFAQEGGPSATANETRLSGVEEQMRALNGRIEQLEFAVHRLEAATQRAQTDTEARLGRLESAGPSAAPAPVPMPQPIAPPPPSSQPAPPQQQPAVNTAPQADVNGTLGALKMQNGKVTGGVNNPQAPPLPVTPPDYGLTAAEQYERAFTLLRQANYPEAEDAFKTFIEKNPQDKLIDNAKYWYGETLYVRARFDEAAVAFADAYQQNPKGTKAPDSLLKLAMALGALNKTPDACVTLRELKTKYPTAAPTIKERAEDERTRLKCPAR